MMTETSNRRPQKLRLAISLLVGSSLFLASAPSYALFGMGKIVFDPWDVAQTSVTATKSVLMYAKQLNQYVTDLNRQLYQVENLANLPQEELNQIMLPAQTLINEKNMLLQEKYQVMGLANVLKNYQGAVTNLAQTYTASGFAPADFLQAYQNQFGVSNSMGTSDLQTMQQDVPIMQNYANNIQKINSEVAAAPNTGDLDAEAHVMMVELDQSLQEQQTLNNSIQQLLATKGNDEVLKAANQKQAQQDVATNVYGLTANAEAMSSSAKKLIDKSSIPPYLQGQYEQDQQNNNYMSQNNTDNGSLVP